MLKVESHYITANRSPSRLCCRLYPWQEKDKEKDEEDEEDEAIEPTMCMPQPIDQSSVCTTVDQIDHVVCLDTNQIANGEVKGLHVSW